jgi:predicted ATPase
MLDERPGSTESEATPPRGRIAMTSPDAGWSGGDRFVGRGDEVARLRSAFDAARNGSGALFLVSGEAGIGKTRLAFEVSSAARAQGIRVVWGRCWEAGGAPPYWPWIEVLRQLLADTDGVSRVALGRHASQLARLVPEAVPGAAPAAAPADPDSGRFLLFDAVAATLRLASARRPVLVVLDDLHAADHVSALLLAFLARAMKDSGVVLIATYRDAEAHSTPALVDALGELSRSASRIALRGLDPADVRSVLEGWHGAPPDDRLCTS